MAFSPTTIEFIDNCIDSQFQNQKNLIMIELGNQHIFHRFLGKSYNSNIKVKTGKEYYTAKGIEHHSFDLNGEDGALKVDLSKPIENSHWSGHFDILTNSGTTEHVEPFESQYTCFKSIHGIVKAGGIIIHIVPCVEDLEKLGYWKYHCNNYYSKEFFAQLCELNSYKLIEQKTIDHNLAVCLQKTEDKPFTDKKELLLSKIKRKNWGAVYKGINDQNTSFFRVQIYRFLKNLHFIRIRMINKFSSNK